MKTIKLNPDLRFGIEVEGNYSKITRGGGYRIENANRIGNYWLSSTDGSIEGGDSEYCCNECGSYDIQDGEFCNECEEYTDINVEGDWKGLELISEVLSPKIIDKALAEFKRLVSGGNDGELGNYAEFNSSCGCHIHFSINGERDMKRFISYLNAEQLTKIFFRRLKVSAKAGTISEQSAKNIMRHYFRSYSREQKGRSDRYQTLNFNSNHPTVEWRSFNLFMVDNWKDFNKAIEIALLSINEMFKKRTLLKPLEFETILEE